MSVDLQTCPGCARRFDAPLTRARPCPFCRARLVIIRDENRTPIELITGREEQERRYRESRELCLENLRRLKEGGRELGISKVRMSAAIDSKSFDECLDSNRVIMSVDEALQTMPLPHRVGTADGKKRCACIFVSHFDDG
jgi:hypothetical protein